MQTTNETGSSDDGKAVVQSAPDVENLKVRLAPFLTKNPWSSIILQEIGGKHVPSVAKPWNEDAVILTLDSKEPALSALIDDLNCLMLAEEFTAIIHLDTGDFEAIWQAFPLPEKLKDLATREFTFRHPMKDSFCQFGPSSSRLLRLADAFLPIEASSTSHRNLLSYKSYAMVQAGAEPFPMFPEGGEPISFFIKGLNLEIDDLITYVLHLNFYMNILTASLLKS